jgi:hypothetical protein
MVIGYHRVGTYQKIPKNPINIAPMDLTMIVVFNQKNRIIP